MNDISSLFIEYGGWSWLILGAILLALEIMVPGIFMLWLGLAAMVTGLATLLFSVNVQAQLIIFAITSVITVLIGRKLFAARNNDTDQPYLNQRRGQLIGKTFVVTSSIENGRGKVKIGDTVWTAEGPDTQIGDRVRVIGVDGNRVLVERTE